MNASQVEAVCRGLIRFINTDPVSAPYVAPAPLVDPDSELRAEVAEALRAQGVAENAILLRTAGDRLLAEATKLGLL